MPEKMLEYHFMNAKHLNSSNLEKIINNLFLKNETLPMALKGHISKFTFEESLAFLLHNLNSLKYATRCNFETGAWATLQ